MQQSFKGKVYLKLETHLNFPKKEIWSVNTPIPEYGSCLENTQELPSCEHDSCLVLPLSLLIQVNSKDPNDIKPLAVGRARMNFVSPVELVIFIQGGYLDPERGTYCS